MMQTQEEKLLQIKAYRSTPEYKAKRIEYDRERLKNPDVVARMKAYRQSERGKDVYKKSQQKLRKTEKFKDYRRAYKATDKAKNARRNQLLKKNFGITLEIYNKMLEEQNSVCAICNKHVEKETRSLAVDHCHSTGKIRGLLCRFCNQAIGHFDDNEELLQSAIRYLNKWHSN